MFLILVFSSLAQKGTIKIFSELEDIHVFLDEDFIGIDVSTLDSVIIGSHYLKIVKDSIVIYGELVEVKENALTTVLIKDSKEVQDILLQDKVDVIKQYKDQRLDVLISTRYITETSTASKNEYYPGFFSSTGETTSNTTSETIAITDWFITHGVNKISEKEFAIITNNQIKLDAMELNYKTVKKKRTNKSLLAPVFLAVGIYGCVKFLIPLIDEGLFELGPLILYLGGIAGFAIIMTSMPQYQTQFYTIDEVRDDANAYNQNLKLDLGLPESYEP